MHPNGDIKEPLLENFIAANDGDIKPITGVRDFFSGFLVESKKIWSLASPGIFSAVCQYSLGAVTQIFCMTLGMGSALETLGEQAYGAGQIDMLGVYLQRSWIILNSTSLLLMFLYIFATPLLKLIGQTDEISEAAGTFAIYMIPKLFAYAFDFPISKFLQAQSKIMVMAFISGVGPAVHTVFSWLFILKLGRGLVGAALVLNASWVFIVATQMAYGFYGGDRGAC